MTPAVISPRSGRAPARRLAPPTAAWRLLRLELKRNLVPYVLPRFTLPPARTTL